jgi:hypothetical protein
MPTAEEIAFKEKLRSLSFKTRPAPAKVTMEGDRREGRKLTESDQGQSVQVFIPPVEHRMDFPMFNEAKEEARDWHADQARAKKAEVAS